MKAFHGCCDSEKVIGSVSPKYQEKKADSIHVMLAGNPNCGKSTLFNRLCNLNVRTGNYPGVTVSRHVGSYGDRIQIIDLPGIYSLNSASTDELVASTELLDNDAELIVNVIDATSLERSLYLTLELKMLGAPMVVLLNMWDEVKKRKISIDLEKLSKMLDADIIPISATSGEGLNAFEDYLRNVKWGVVEPVYLGSDRIVRELSAVADVTPNLYKSHALFYAKSAVLGDSCPEALTKDEKWLAAVETAKNNIASGFDTIYQAMASDRYDYVDRIISECVAGGAQEAEGRKKSGLSAKIDAVVLNRYMAFPIFILIMCAVYYISVSWLGSIATDWANDTLFGEEIIPAVTGTMTSLGASEWLTSLVSDGVVGGVGAVLGFVPQMIILFFLLSVLEECGYMTRAAFILDRIFNSFGLSGRAFIPYLIGSGCGVPALMTARTLGSESERRVTLFTTTMIPCSAKLPVIITMAGAVFNDFLVFDIFGTEFRMFAPVMYLSAVFIVILSAVILSKFSQFKSSASSLMLELPDYHRPMLRVVVLSIWQRVKGYIFKAGRIIFPCVTILWLVSHIGYVAEDGRFEMLDDSDTDNSLVADLVRPVSGVFAPLGFDDYRASVAVITGLVAKEAIVSTMAVFVGVDEPEEPEDDASDEELAESEEQTNAFYTAIKNRMFHVDELGIKGVLAAFAFVIFNLFTIPCVAAVGVLRKEIGSSRLFWIAIAYQLGLSYGIAMVVYQFGLVFAGAAPFSLWTGISIAFLLVIAYILFIKKAPATEQSISFEFVKD